MQASQRPVIRSTVNLAIILQILPCGRSKVDKGKTLYKPDGRTDIVGLENGKTYKVSVRAVNRNSADGTVVAYGEWSDAVDYTYAKKVAGAEECDNLCS